MQAEEAVVACMGNPGLVAELLVPGQQRAGMAAVQLGSAWVLNLAKVLLLLLLEPPGLVG